MKKRSLFVELPLCLVNADLRLKMTLCNQNLGLDNREGDIYYLWKYSKRAQGMIQVKRRRRPRPMIQGKLEIQAIRHLESIRQSSFSENPKKHKTHNIGLDHYLVGKG